MAVQGSHFFLVRGTLTGHTQSAMLIKIDLKPHGLDEHLA